VCSAAESSWIFVFCQHVALKPHSSHAWLLNFVGEESPDTIRAAFGNNYERLSQLEKKYDATNFFSLNQNVKPAS